MRLLVSLSFIIAGVTLFFYPAFKDYVQAKSQDQLIEQWEIGSLTINEESKLLPTATRNSLSELNRTFESAPEISPTVSPIKQTQMVEPVKKEKIKAVPLNLVGIIKISKINLKLPIQKGTSKKVLAAGAGHLEGTAYPGNEGNSAIAAHRSRTFGRMFNRLAEIQQGDEIIVETTEGIYRYVVFEKSIVKPTDLSVLKNRGNEKIITLITCHPLKNPTHRLIIQARLS
jgi:sortase A